MKIDKKKLLGQFFSGNKIAEMIEALIPSAGICSVIDPMCGIGDLLLPFSNTANVTGIEIDKELRDELTKRLPNAFCISSNAFTIQTLSRLNCGGYDLVVTNPPYIRKELIGRAEETNLSLMEICSNLHLFADKFSTLNKEEKLIMHSAIDSVSGLSDMSIPSWLLCIMLVKKGGKFAIVLPNSWLSREYSQPILSLIDELFDVNYVVNDVNGVWFKGNALVRTSIIIASRKPSNYTNTCIVDLYKSAQNEDSLFGNISTPVGLADFLAEERSIPRVCEVKLISKRPLASLQTERVINCIHAVEPKNNAFSGMKYIEDLGVKISQGLRTGANGFFYLNRNGSKLLKSSISAVSIRYDDDLFVPVIQNQSDLSNSYLIDGEACTFLLNIQNSISKFDFDKTEAINRSGYKLLPQDIQKYIRESENIKIKGHLIPTLSSVKTNVRRSKNGLYRFWYMIPSLQTRHKAKVFIPRVNNLDVITYKCDIKDAVIDANFSTIDNSENKSISEYALIAMLNTVWCKVQYEQLGTVMGAGALKLDAAQIRKVRIPELSKKTLVDLDMIGKKLTQCSIDESSTIIDEADLSILSSFMTNRKQSKILLSLLKIELQHFINARK